MARKTVDIATLRDEANLLLALEDGNGPDPVVNRMFRRGVISLIDRVLHDTDNYKGFQYLGSEFEREELPGGSRRVLREDYDPTRIQYY